MDILDLRSAAAASQATRTQVGARPAALRMLCLLCCGGAPIARRLLAAGMCASSGKGWIYTLL